ncbi:MAG: VOC family protein [bacterium]|nr:VOC family protein [bacterium]
MTMISVTPALPVLDLGVAAAFYRDRLGFTVVHLDDGIAVLRRDEAWIHLWCSNNEDWREIDPVELAQRPVRMGAESFLSGTASCRIQVDNVDELFQEMTAQSVVHPVSKSGPTDTEWDTQEFAALDLDGNLLAFFQLREQ